MSRVCQISGKKVQVGHRVSHSNVKTKHRFLPNLHKKKCWSQELGRFITLRISASSIRTLDKLGLDAYAKKMGLKLS